MLINERPSKIVQWWCGIWNGHRDSTLISKDGCLRLQCLSCLKDLGKGWKIRTEEKQAKIAGQK